VLDRLDWFDPLRFTLWFLVIEFLATPLGMGRLEHRISWRIWLKTTIPFTLGVGAVHCAHTFLSERFPCDPWSFLIFLVAIVLWKEIVRNCMYMIKGGVEVFSGIMFALIFHGRVEWVIDQAYRFVEFGCFWALPLFIGLIKYSPRDWLDYGKQEKLDGLVSILEPYLKMSIVIGFVDLSFQMKISTLEQMVSSH